LAIDGHYWPQYDQNVIQILKLMLTQPSLFPSQGYRAWTTFGSGAFLDHLDPIQQLKLQYFRNSRFNVLNYSSSASSRNIIGLTQRTNYGLSAADLTPPLQVPEPSLSATPWYLDRNLVTWNPHARGMYNQ